MHAFDGQILRARPWVCIRSHAVKTDSILLFERASRADYLRDLNAGRETFRQNLNTILYATYQCTQCSRASTKRAI